MNSQLEFIGRPQLQMLVQDTRHLRFSTQQTTLHKVHSLRKVNTYNPPYQP